MHGSHLELVKHSMHQNKSEVGVSLTSDLFIPVFLNKHLQILSKFSDKVAIIKATRYNNINRKKEIYMNQYPLVYLDHVTKNYGHEVTLMDVSLNINLAVLLAFWVPMVVGKQPSLN